MSETNITNDVINRVNSNCHIWQKDGPKEKNEF